MSLSCCFLIILLASLLENSLIKLIVAWGVVHSKRVFLSYLEFRIVVPNCVLCVFLYCV